MDEIVVTGTPGVTRRRAIANTVARVDAVAALAAAPIQDVDDLLVRVNGAFALDDERPAHTLAGTTIRDQRPSPRRCRVTEQDRGPRLT